MMEEKNYLVIDILGVEGLVADSWGEILKMVQDFVDICDGFKTHREYHYYEEFWHHGKTYYCYPLRGGKDNDPGALCTIEARPVTVNFWGIVVLREKLSFPKGKDYIELREDDWGFTGEDMSVKEFIGEDAE